MKSMKMRLLGILALSLCSVVLGDIKRVKEGDDVEFPCKYPSNYQNPRIEWTFNSGEEITLVYYNGDLTASYKNRVRYYPQGFQLKGVTRKDAGVYKCEVTDASSGNVSYMEVKTQLIVVIGSVVIGDIKRVKEGDDVEFPCKYPSNYQNPHIEWTFNSGEEITLVYYNGDLTASYKNRVRYYPQGLQLKGVTRKDAGVYKCEVTDASSGNVNYMEVKTQLIVVIDCEQQHNP